MRPTPKVATLEEWNAPGRRRAKGKPAPAAPAPEALDLDAPFELESAPAGVVNTPLRPDPLEAKRAQLDAAVLEPEPELVISGPIAELPAPVGKTDGWSRTVSALGPQEVWDYERQCWAYDLNPTSSVGHYEGAQWDPWNTGGEAIESNAYQPKGLALDHTRLSLRDERTRAAGTPRGGSEGTIYAAYL